jgi:hypothetical protein
MTRSGFLAGAAALALLVAAPSAGFAQRGGHGGGGHMGGGGGGGMHMGGGGGGHMGGGGGMRMGSPGAGASFARSAPAAGVAAASPNIGARGNWAGNRTAWNGGGNWHGGNWNGDRFRHNRFPGAFAAGALVGGALAANSYAYYGDPYYNYEPDYYADNTYYDAGPEVAVVQEGGGDASYCAQRYKSWDPASGTYLGYDGQRHPCP